MVHTEARASLGSVGWAQQLWQCPEQHFSVCCPSQTVQQLGRGGVAWLEAWLVSRVRVRGQVEGFLQKLLSPSGGTSMISPVCYLCIFSGSGAEFRPSLSTGSTWPTDLLTASTLVAE